MTRPMPSCIKSLGFGRIQVTDKTIAKRRQVSHFLQQEEIVAKK
jgi:hypothetical protein